MANDCLLIDLGNSRIKWARATAGQRGQAHASPYAPGGLEPILDQHWGGQSPPQRVLLCRVAAPEVEHELRQWLARHWRVSPFHFTSEFPVLGMRSGYRDRAALGDDRWLAVVAAFGREGRAVAVIDCGSAITIDLVAADGAHRGGWILPGIRLMADCLRRGTAILPFEVGSGTLAPGGDTGACIANGALLACVGAVERAAREIAAHPPWRQVKWLITGGDARLVQPWLGIPCELVEHLLLDGLLHIASLTGEGPC